MRYYHGIYEMGKPKKNTTKPIKKGRAEHSSSKKKFYISFLTLVLLILLVQLLAGTGINVVRSLGLSTKLSSLKELNRIATQKNIILKEEMEKYTSNEGVEALARNRLQLVGENEILVIINDEQEEPIQAEEQSELQNKINSFKKALESKKEENKQ